MIKRESIINNQFIKHYRRKIIMVNCSKYIINNIYNSQDCYIFHFTNYNTYLLVCKNCNIIL